MTRYRTHFWILAALVFLFYANILPNAFVWDDNIFILQNHFIREWRNIPRLFQSDFFSLSPRRGAFDEKEGGYYRPLVMLCYTVEYHLWGFNPFFYHLVSLLLHLLNVFLVYRLFHRLFQSEKIAIIGSFLFASCPLHTEAVSYLPSRGDLLATLFCLLSLHLALAPEKFKKGLSPFFFVMGLLSKESAMVFPLLFVAYGVLVEKRKKDWAPTAGIFFAILFLYGFLRFFFFPFRVQSTVAHAPGLFLRVLSLGQLILSYLILWIVPYPLHLEKRAPFVRGIGDIGGFLFLLAALGIVWIIHSLWKKNRPLLFGVVWFLISFLPISNLLLIYPSMADHYLYFPSIGLDAVGSYFLYRFFVTRRKRDQELFLCLGIFVITLYGLLVIRRNQDYSDEITLFRQTLRYAPYSATTHNNLGAVYISKGFREEAKKEFEQSLSLNSDQPKVWANLGTVYRESREYDRAIEYLKKAIARKPDEAIFWNKLGIAYAEQGSGETERVFQTAIEKDPFYGDAYMNLGSWYWKKGEFKKAHSVWREGTLKDPEHGPLKTWFFLSEAKLFPKEEKP